MKLASFFNHRLIQNNTIFAALFVAFIISGCYEMMVEEEFGIVDAEFAISSDQISCEEAGVESIVAVLGDGEYSETVPCNDHRIRINGIEPGEYALTLYGVNREGTRVVDNLKDGGQSVHVRPGETTDVQHPIDLTESPIRLKMRWSLGWGTCKSRGLHRFVVESYDADGQVIFAGKLACKTDGTLAGDFRMVPNPKRELVNPDMAAVVVYPVDKNGSRFSDEFAVEYADEEIPEIGPGESWGMSIVCSPSRCLKSEDTICGR
jgi:hypothetical protein